MRFLAKHTNVPLVATALPSRKPHSGKGMDTQAGLQNRAPYQAVCKAEDITEESVHFLPGILKTRYFGL